MSRSKKAPSKVTKVHEIDRQVSRIIMLLSVFGITLFVLVSPMIAMHGFADKLLILHIVGIISFALAIYGSLVTYNNKYLDALISNVPVGTKGVKKLKGHLKKCSLIKVLFRSELIHIVFLVGFLSLIATVAVLPYDYSRHGIMSPHKFEKNYCPAKKHHKKKCCRHGDMH